MNELETLLLRIRGLVSVRELLRQRGASDEELEEHSAEIGRLQGGSRRRCGATSRRTRVTGPRDAGAAGRPGAYSFPVM